MPIDISLLRPPNEGGNINEVLRWQLCRLSTKKGEASPTAPSACEHSHDNNNPNHDPIIRDNIEYLIQLISKLDKEKRQLLKDGCRCRSKLKQLQVSLAPKKKNEKNKQYDDQNTNAWNDDESINKNDDNNVVRDVKIFDVLKQDENINVEEVRREIGILKEKIPQIERDIHNVVKSIDLLCPRLMNIVIDDNYNMHIDANASSSCGRDNFVHRIENEDDASIIQDVIIDPLYCIGGYEKVVLPTWQHPSSLHHGFASQHHHDKEKAFLCGHGSMIYDALQVYVQKFFHKSFQDDDDDNHTSSVIINIPESIPLHSIDSAHSLMGCKAGDALTIGGETNTCTICNNKFGNAPATNAPSHIALSMLHQNKSFSDRELPKKFICASTVSEAQIGRGPSSFLCLTHPIKRLEVFAIVTSNLKLSTELQDDVVRKIVTLYKSLLITSTEIETESCKLISKRFKTTPLLRTRSVVPSQLEPSEARRIRIEGYLPSRGKYICLAHVSNHTDYVSRGLKIKCNGGHGQPMQYVHLIHGSVCDQVALSWLLENNIVSLAANSGDSRQEKKKSQHGVMIPHAVSQSIHTGSLNRETGSKSLLFIPFTREFVKGKLGKLSHKDIKGSKSTVWFNLDHLEDSLMAKSNNAKIETQSCFSLELPRAQDEATCNPYSFLPFIL